MTSQTDLTGQDEIPENILAWTPSVNKSLPDFEAKRRRSPDKPPLLKQLLLYSSENNDNAKHFEYTVHSLIQRQAREYVCAVEDVIRVFKNATERVNESASGWRGTNGGTLNESSVSDHSDGAELTEIGRNIVKISEAVKCIQENDALTFWTSQQRSMVLQLLVSTSKSAVKLRRKLTRIKDSLEDRVRNVRRVAIKCNCEIRDNSVPVDVYNKWEKEDSFLYNLNRCNNDTIASSPSPNVSNIKAKIYALKKMAMNIVSCIYPISHSSSISKVETDSSCSSFQSKSSVPLNGPVRVYQIETSIQILHKSNYIDTDEEIVCEPVPKKSPKSMATNVTSANGPLLNDKVIHPPSQVMQLATKDLCATNPSQKYLETIKTIMSNVTPPQIFNTSEYVYVHCESRIKAAVCEDNPECALVEEITNRNTILSSPSNSNNSEDLEIPMEYENRSTCLITSTANESTGSLSNTTTAPRFLSNAMQKQISSILEANDVMYDIINKTTWEIREMEREWLSPEKMPKCKKLHKELYQLVDFIVETAKMTKDEEISLRIYPEDREHIISVLDPVLRELTKCFVSIHLLHNLISEDIQYLKELVTGFPKGGLVIRDWVSDPSIDDELADMEQPNAATDIDVDVDELFG